MSKIRVWKQTREPTGIRYVGTYPPVDDNNRVHRLPLGIPFKGHREWRGRHEVGEQPEQRQGEYHGTLLLPRYETWTKHYIAKGTPDESGMRVVSGRVPPVAAFKRLGDHVPDIGVDDQFFQVFAVSCDRYEALYGAIDRMGTWECPKTQCSELRHRFDKLLDVFVGEFVQESTSTADQINLQHRQLVQK